MSPCVEDGFWSYLSCYLPEHALTLCLGLYRRLGVHDLVLSSEVEELDKNFYFPSQCPFLLLLVKTCFLFFPLCILLFPHCLWIYSSWGRSLRFFHKTSFFPFPSGTGQGGRHWIQARALRFSRGNWNLNGAPSWQQHPDGHLTAVSGKHVP